MDVLRIDMLTFHRFQDCLMWSPPISFGCNLCSHESKADCSELLCICALARHKAQSPPRAGSHRIVISKENYRLNREAWTEDLISSFRGQEVPRDLGLHIALQ
ncbi:unnamed protein product [Eretmochelys imbricata]